MPQTWNSLKSVYEASKNYVCINSYLVVVPYSFVKSDGFIITSSEYWRVNGEDIIDAYADSRWFDLRKLRPDIIFRQDPYDDTFPPIYRMKNISRYAKLCYVPYGYNCSPNKHFYIGYNDTFITYAYAVFTENNSAADFCNKKKEKVKGWNSLKVYNVGFPRFDLIDKIEYFNDNITTFMWIPRWSLDSSDNDGTSFFLYKDKLLSFFSEHERLNLIIRPHPLMFSNFIKQGVMTQQEVDDFTNNVNRCKNIHFDNEMDYLVTFNETDVLIADFSTLNVEFFLSGKSIIYCGSEMDVEIEVKRMFELFYKVENWDELVKCMEQLSDGYDPNRSMRKEEINKFLEDGAINIGDTIIQSCLKFDRKEG